MTGAQCGHASGGCGAGQPVYSCAPGQRLQGGTPMNILLFGATGMLGQDALRERLLAPS